MEAHLIIKLLRPLVKHSSATALTPEIVQVEVIVVVRHIVYEVVRLPVHKSCRRYPIWLHDYECHLVIPRFVLEYEFSLSPTSANRTRHLID